MPRSLATAADLRASAAADSEVLTSLNAGDVFEVLELAGNRAWGVAPATGIVGYIPAAALTDAQ
ncbi:SH3 domain-containing protein [Sphingomonas gei]